MQQSIILSIPRSCQRIQSRGDSKAMTHISRCLGLLAMHFGEELFQPILEYFVFLALVEFADEMSAWFERLAHKGEGSGTEVLEWY